MVETSCMLKSVSVTKGHLPCRNRVCITIRSCTSGESKTATRTRGPREKLTSPVVLITEREKYNILIFKCRVFCLWNLLWDWTAQIPVNRPEIRLFGILIVISNRVWVWAHIPLVTVVSPASHNLCSCPYTVCEMPVGVRAECFDLGPEQESSCSQ